MMMDTSRPSSIIRFLPVTRPLNPGHDIPENPDPPVLDLCVRKRPLSPDYPHDHTSIKCVHTVVEPQIITSPKSLSELSESTEVSSSETKDINSNCSSTKLKPSRPFKAYSKDTFSLAFIGTTTDILGKDSADAYAEFRQNMLSYVQASHNNGTNKNMRRTQNQNPHQIADPTYWEKRKKNNEAAKRSRDARRAKEDEIAIRCAFLEQENIKLKFRLAALESEKERLQSLVYH